MGISNKETREEAAVSDNIRRPSGIISLDVEYEALLETAGALPVNEVYQVPKQNAGRCIVHSKQLYDHLYWRSINDSENFWKEKAFSFLRWHQPFTKTFHGSMADGDISWFCNGKLNVCENCVDRWAEQYPDRLALIFEGDEPSDSSTVTYRDLLVQVCKMANFLMKLGVKKGDIVTIYLPMLPYIAFSMLACVRIGAIHSVVFGGFSANSLAERITDANSKVLITAECAYRGGRKILMKDIAENAIKKCGRIKHLVVFQPLSESVHLGDDEEDQIVKSTPAVDRNIVLDNILDNQLLPVKSSSAGQSRTYTYIEWNGNACLNDMRPYCPLESVDSEHVMFLLYTSGSTGVPKGICHSSAGYLLYSAMTHKMVFDYHEGDIYCCVADCGWITGHSYVLYGPLCNGATTVLFQSTPVYPDAGRYWATVEKWKCTQFYTSPSALRSLMRFGDKWVQKYNLSSLRVLGSVGEPINPEAWRWYYHVVGQGRCSIVDTYWQTETGGHVLSPLPGAFFTKPGSATLPFLGISPVILDPQTGKEKEGNNVFGILAFKAPWPGMCRTVHGAHTRFLNTYFKPYPGYYFSGDGAYRDSDGYYWITGRVDDTLNVSGHRLGAAEIEHALAQHPSVAEAAVVAVPHDVKGSGIFCFVVFKFGVEDTSELITQLKQNVRSSIGPIATPDIIVPVPGLPKTCSGKIMRRLLRKMACKDSRPFGDLSTLVNPEVLEKLKRTMNTVNVDWMSHGSP